MIRTHYLIAIVLIIVFSGALYLSDVRRGDKTVVEVPEVSEGNVLVILGKDGYEPSDLTIPVGTTVTFVSTTGKPHWPASNLHPTHEIYSEFDPKRPLAPDETWSFTFDRVGVWNFHDHIRAYYTGTVQVE